MTDLATDLSPAYLNRLLVDLDILNNELAVMAGVSVRTVYRWLGGATPITERGRRKSGSCLPRR